MYYHKSRFTFLQLCILVALIGVFVGFSTPGTFSVLTAGDVSSDARKLADAMYFARNEADSQGMPVSLCPARDGRYCEAQPESYSDWLVFSDRNGNGQIDMGDDRPVKVFNRIVNGTQIIPDPTVKSGMTFLPGGAIRSENGHLVRGSVFTVCPSTADEALAQQVGLGSDGVIRIRDVGNDRHDLCRV